MSKLNRYTKNPSVWMLIVFCCYACRLTYDKSPLTPTHQPRHIYLSLILPCFLQSTAWPSQLSNALILISPRLKTNSKRIFTITTFKPRLQFVALRNKNKTEHTQHPQHTDTTQEERDKQDCRDVMSVRLTSGPSACCRVELILNQLWPRVVG